jgi:hypothetical protein
MAILRFPSNAQEGGRPYVLFTTHEAQYNNFGAKITSTPTSNGVVLYLPANYNVNDILRYDTEDTGIIGNAFERVTTGTGLTTEDLKDAAEAVAVGKAGEIAAGAAGLVASTAGGTIGTIASTLITASAVGNIKSEALKRYQQTINPREFLLFKAPSIRQFGFNFNFIPTSEQEARDVPEIIKFFRKASYPALHAHGLQYVFPEAFNINFGNSNKIIKIPEVVCIGTSITYNPNSISYYKQDNLPVEINVQISFQELQPITKGLVEAGY